MFLGHFGVAFALKRIAPTLSLGWLALAAMFADLLFLSLILAGVEMVDIIQGTVVATSLVLLHYPYSHSLAATAVYAGVAYAAIRLGPFARSQWRSLIAAAIALALLSHFVLDVVVHGPDVPLLDGGSPQIGVGLWSLPLAAYLLEAAIIVGGVAIYLTALKGTTRGGKYGMIAFAGALIVLNGLLGYGPPLAGVEVFTVLGLILFPLLIVIAYWLDRKAGT